MKFLILPLLGIALSVSAFSANALNDAQITKVVLTVDKGETELGQLAKDSSKNPDVLGFANHMMTDHLKGQQKAMALAKQLSLAPQDSKKSASMKKDTDLTKGLLMSKQSSVEFDKAYMDAMVRAHEKVLQGIDSELLPAAQNEELKAMLKTKRETVMSHLKYAKEIQTKLF
jgi:putative membrane protein